MITNEVYFFKNQSSVSTSDSLYNVNDGTLILQVDGNVSNLELLVLGNTDLIDDDFVTLKTINATDYSMSDKITSTGIYWIDINGIRKIKLNLSKITGSVNVKALTKRGLTTDLVARAMAANASGGGSYTLPVASADTLGGIKIGENLTIDENGVVNANGINTPEFFINIPSVSIKINDRYTTYTLSDDFNSQLTTVINNIFGTYQRFTVMFLVNYVLAKFKPSVQSYSDGRGTLTLESHPRQINLYAVIDSGSNTSTSSSDPVVFGGYIPLILTIYLSWDGDIASVTKTTFKMYGNSGIIPSLNYMREQTLFKDNTTQYTPSGNYHPATKKYVDDAITTAITTSLEGSY